MTQPAGRAEGAAALIEGTEVAAGTHSASTWLSVWVVTSGP